MVKEKPSPLSLKIEKLSVAYNGRPVLHDVNLELCPGKVTAVIGPNGAGKSTLIRSASGVLPAEKGRVMVDGKNIHSLSPEQRARHVAVVPQAVQLPETFTVYETVLMGRISYLGWFGQESERDQQIAQLSMQRTGIDALADRRIGELSGGERQRVLIARALAQSAPVLLMDEPTSHLDLRHQSGVLSLVRSLAEQENLAVLVALHDLNLASLYADEVALLVDGKICIGGSPQKVLTTHVLSQAYGVHVEVIPHPIYGIPLVLPDGR